MQLLPLTVLLHARCRQGQGPRALLQLKGQHRLPTRIPATPAQTTQFLHQQQLSWTGLGFVLVLLAFYRPGPC